MSVKIMSKVWPLQMGHADKLVLLALADNANDEGECWPSVVTLCEKTCLSDRAIQKCVGRLKADGHISVLPRYKKSNVFRVHPSTVYPERGSPEQRSPEQGSPERNDISTPNDVHPLKTEPSKRTIKAPGVPIELHASLPRESWGEWLAHRRERKWSMSPRALNPQLKLLAKFDTETQREIIETSMQAGWQGLFPPKGQPKTNGERGKWM